MKKKIVLVLLVLVLALTACGGSGKESTKLKIGVSPVPHAEIAEIAKEKLAKDGIELEIVVFDDYVQPNLALKDGDLDANFFQHVPYLEEFNKEHKTEIVSAGGVHVEPIAFYSTKVKSLEELEDGAEVLIPNDASNGSRALKLLEKNGLIKLKEGANLVTELDIVENTKNIKFTPVEAALIPASYAEVGGAVINSNYAISAGLNPVKDGIVIEGQESDYSNVIAIRTADKDNENLKKLVEAFQSTEVKNFIEEKYEGSVVPAF